MVITQLLHGKEKRKKHTQEKRTPANLKK